MFTKYILLGYSIPSNPPPFELPEYAQGKLLPIVGISRIKEVEIRVAQYLYAVDNRGTVPQLAKDLGRLSVLLPGVEEALAILGKQDVSEVLNSHLIWEEFSAESKEKLNPLSSIFGISEDKISKISESISSLQELVAAVGVPGAKKRKDDLSCWFLHELANIIHDHHGTIVKRRDEWGRPANLLRKIVKILQPFLADKGREISDHYLKEVILSFRKEVKTV